MTPRDDDDIHAAPGMQLDLFAGPADPARLIDLHRVLLHVSTRPKCGCTCGYVQRVGVHVGIYCAGHGRWIQWLDAAGRERARRAGGVA